MTLIYQLPRDSLQESNSAMNRAVILTESLIKIVTAYRQFGNRNEAGGILLGRMWPGRSVIEIASTPGQGDKSGRYFFERDSLRAQHIIKTVWQESKGEINYFGEWHTHPEPHPCPSLRDRAMMTEMFDGTISHQGALFLLIIGTCSLWLGQRDENGLQALERVTT